MRRWCFLLCAALVGCKTAARYEVTTVVRAEQARDVQRDARYRYVLTGLTASASARTDTVEAIDLASRTMNELVTKAQLKANQTLIDVTLEEGVVDRDGEPGIRVVTIRADVIEIVGARR